MTWDLFWMIMLIWIFVGIPLTFFVAAMIGKKGVSVSDRTLQKVYISLDEAGIPFLEGMEAVTRMQDKGIVFMEVGVKPDEKEPAK